MKETTSIMLWMLLFLLLITFWVDLRIRGLREEFLRHCLLIERSVSGAAAPTTARSYTTDAQALTLDGSTHAPWTDGRDALRPTAALPQFIDDIVPTKDELARALRGVDSTVPGPVLRPAPYGTSFDGYEGTIYAPVFPPSMAQ
jgi:hypothetical protein